MEQFSEFMSQYFIYIWFVGVISTFIIIYVRGRKAMEVFSSLNACNWVYVEKGVSGYSTKSFKTRWGGGSNVFHVLISDKELVIKTFLLFAYFAKRSDMLHRIPLHRISRVEIKKRAIISKLFIEFEGENGVSKEIVLMSDNNAQIKKILDPYIA